MPVISAAFIAHGELDRRDACPTKFLPDFLKPLPLAVVVAKNVDGIILPQPAVKLLEKFAALRLGDLRFRRALGQRTEGVEDVEIADWRDPRDLCEIRPRSRLSPAVAQLNSTDVKPRRFNSTRKSGHEMKNGSSAGTCCA